MNGRSFSPDGLRQAVRDAGDGRNDGRVALATRRGSYVDNAYVEASRGLRYPHLERIEDVPRRIDAILAPLRP
ncbi:hypothetical protein ASE95_01090 [Sphingomonas sp. Leaf231]|uniref:hypothetical protein n=1 Tax=Sphingomonas sp. Leaf231 TaxID=1736301 RepID=UPI0007010D50|nr:hypothetical protein [Sphingomonas sp. Leaf231]KQN93574.1 hypothetical protein ASE95_01090 [Sphingomonas sp. Leaf231]